LIINYIIYFEESKMASCWLAPWWHRVSEDSCGRLMSVIEKKPKFTATKAS